MPSIQSALTRLENQLSRDPKHDVGKLLEKLENITLESDTLETFEDWRQMQLTVVESLKDQGNDLLEQRTLRSSQRGFFPRFFPKSKVPNIHWPHTGLS